MIDILTPSLYLILEETSSTQMRESELKEMFIGHITLEAYRKTEIPLDKIQISTQNHSIKICPVLFSMMSFFPSLWGSLCNLFTSIKHVNQNGKSNQRIICRLPTYFL